MNTKTDNLGLNRLKLCFSHFPCCFTVFSGPWLLRYSVWLKFSVFCKSRNLKVKLFRQSQIVRHTYPGFECPKISRNLPKILLKFENFDICWYNVKNVPELLKIESLCWKFRYIFDILPTNVKIFESVRHICNVSHIRDVRHIHVVRHTGKCIHSKNAFKTVLARTGAKKNSFSGFWVYFCQKLVQFRLNLGLKTH